MSEKVDIPGSDKLPTSRTPAEKDRLRQDYFQIKNKYDSLVENSGGSIGEIRIKAPESNKWLVNQTTQAGKDLRRNVKADFKKNREMEAALKDSLTGLDSRNMLDVRIQETITDQKRQLRHLDEDLKSGRIKDNSYARKKTQAALIMIDLPDLKKLNDSKHGHQAGDTLLAAFGSIILQTTKTSDARLRIGGDEFVLILKRTDKKGARAAWARIAQILADLQIADKGIYGIKPNAGFALLDPNNPDYDPYEALKKADRAMYKAKRRFKKTGENLFEDVDDLTQQELTDPDYQNLERAA